MSRLRSVRFTGVGVIALLAVLVAACQSSGGGEASAGSVTAGIGIDASYAPFVVAKEKGFMAKHGVDYNYRTFETGVVGLDALMAGQVDLAGTGNLPTVAARAKGGKFAVTAMYVSSDVFFGAVVRENIKTPQDLAKPGTRIGVTIGSGGQFWLETYIKHYKLDMSQAKITNVAAPDLVAAATRGEIDAAFTWEPHLLRTVQSAKGWKMLAYSGDDGVFTQRQYLDVSTRVLENDKLMSAVQKAMAETGEWMEKNPKETAKIVGKLLGTDEKTALEQVKKFNYVLSFNDADQSTLKQAADFLTANKKITSAPDWKIFIRADVLKTAAPDADVSIDS